MAFRKALITLLVSYAVQAVYGAIGPVADLTVSNKIITPDGLERHAVLAEGTFPGPLISGNKGDRFQINVINNLTDPTLLRSTSINWHGIYQKESSWADGVVGVTQCPIAPGQAFLYEFTPDEQAGTFLYHSHIGNQACDGLRGPLVIYDPNDPHKIHYDIDDESTIITLADWYHIQTPSIPLITDIPVSDSTLINGKGRYSFPAPGSNAELAVVNVAAGKRYRMRLVSISCDADYTFSIDNHQMMIIEVDGHSTVPYTVDVVRIFAGQRYSFVLNANQPVDNYRIRAQPNIGLNLTGFDNGINSAILRYEGAEIAEPTSCPTENPNIFDESELHPLDNPSAPGEPYPGGADLSYNLNIALDDKTKKWSINGMVYTPATSPVLLQALEGVQDPRLFMPEGSVITVPRNKVIEVSIPATVGITHPFHLSGHSFSVIRSSGANATTNYANPVRRDTVDIGTPGSNVTFRFETNNPGPWLLRCEIDFHLSNGMAIVFAEDPQDVANTNTAPTSWYELCPIYDNLPPSATSVSYTKPVFTVSPTPK